MALSGDSRMDRRRRALRDASQSAFAGASRAGQDGADDDSENAAAGKRSAGYSLNVRQACGVRLVQLIPVRRRSFSAIVGLSILLTATLLAAHYLIYVSGTLAWYGHPLATTLDAAHPQSIAAWLSSHLWLLCLGATILTFQIRRHKLDDYSGEYRLWFWLVITCLIGSIDSTARVSELFGNALDHWSQLNLGWSGKSVVQATVTVLVGMLGLRLCTELKSVPLSLAFWLTGLLAWAGSAALAQERFQIDLTVQMRFWLRSALWLGGQTAIWIAALTYLRHVYIQAQHRFLVRGLLTRPRTHSSLSQRMKESLSFLRRREKSADEVKPARRRKPPAPEEQESSEQPQPIISLAQTANTTSAGRSGPLSLANRRPNVSAQSSSLPTPRSTTTSAQSSKDPAQKSGRWGFKLWPGKSLRDDEADEYRKIQAADTRQKVSTERQAARQAAATAKAEDKAERLAQREAARQAKQESGSKSGGFKKRSLLLPLTWVGAAFGKLKLPSLSGFKLAPPDADETTERPRSTGYSSQLRPVGVDKAVPGTSRSMQDDEDDQDSDRYVSKSERKRLRRQNRAA